MAGRVWLIAAVATAVCASIGCVNCRHKGYQDALSPEVPPVYPPPTRNQVYLFMMNGCDVLECAGMLRLRDELCLAGYPMVYYAQRPDQEWYTRELRRVARDNPAARILLLGYGSAAGKVASLAVDASRDQLPIDAVIFLDPMGLNADLMGGLPYRTITVCSRQWSGSTGLETAESFTVDSRHYALPSHPATQSLLVDLMTESAGQVVLPPADNLPRLPLRDRREPTPRGIDPATTRIDALTPWDYLKPGPPFPDIPEPELRSFGPEPWWLH